MKSSVKFIVMLALLMLSFCIGGDAVNFIAMCDNRTTEVCNSTCEILDASADLPVLSNINGDKVYRSNGVHAFTFSDIELGFKPVTETYSFFNSQRMRRAVEFSDFFKGLMHGLCLRENLLVLDKSKFYHSDEDPYTAQLGCEYYVFALRRILI